MSKEDDEYATISLWGANIAAVAIFLFILIGAIRHGFPIGQSILAAIICGLIAGGIGFMVALPVYGIVGGIILLPIALAELAIKNWKPVVTVGGTLGGIALLLYITWNLHL